MTTSTKVTNRKMMNTAMCVLILSVVRAVEHFASPLVPPADQGTFPYHREDGRPCDPITPNTRRGSPSTPGNTGEMPSLLHSPNSPNGPIHTPSPSIKHGSASGTISISAFTMEIERDLYQQSDVDLLIIRSDREYRFESPRSL